MDVSALNIGDSIHVRDIALPEGVRTKIQPDLTVFSVMAPTVEEEPVAEVAAEGAAAGPEVIREKKEEAAAARRRRRLRRPRKKKKRRSDRSIAFFAAQFCH